MNLWGHINHETKEISVWATICIFAKFCVLNLLCGSAGMFVFMEYFPDAPGFIGIGLIVIAILCAEIITRCTFNVGFFQIFAVR